MPMTAKSSWSREQLSDAPCLHQPAQRLKTTFAFNLQPKLAFPFRRVMNGQLQHNPVKPSPTTTGRLISRNLCEPLSSVFDWHIWAKLTLTPKPIPHLRILEEVQKRLSFPFFRNCVWSFPLCLVWILSKSSFCSRQFGFMVLLCSSFAASLKFPSTIQDDAAGRRL
jgi:hypothetical protein